MSSVSHTCTRLPDICYVEGDSVKVTFGECSCNLGFDDLTGYRSRNCDKFYYLIPQLGQYVKLPEYVKIPVFSVQVTLFPNRGISIGMSSHHSLGDASTQFSFLKAWTSIAQHGTDESFLANGTLPVYERYPPTPDESDLNRMEVETFWKKEHDHQPFYLSGPTNKVRATFILTRTIIDQLRKRVLAQLPNLPHVSSLTVACGYIWYCIARSQDVVELHLFALPIDCRKRLDLPVQGAYFGNCVLASITTETTRVLSGDNGFITAVKLIGENLHNMLTDKDGVVKHRTRVMNALLSKGFVPKIIAVTGSPKLKLYDLDFGWGKPKKIERIPIDYSNAISVDASKESYKDLEIGVCLTDTQMQAFTCIFNEEQHRFGLRA